MLTVLFLSLCIAIWLPSTYLVRKLLLGSDCMTQTGVVVKLDLRVIVLLDEGVSTSSSVREDSQILRSGLVAAIKQNRMVSVDADAVAMVDQQPAEQTVSEAGPKKGTKKCTKVNAKRGSKSSSKTPGAKFGF